MKNYLWIIVLLVFLWSCQGNKKAEDSTPQNLTFSLTELWRTDTVLLTAESVLYDPVHELLFVANMNRVEDGETGYITKMKTDGEILDLHWIDGLIEPRGMGIYGDKLFATDMNRLIVVDIEKGELIKTVPVEGAVFLNDLAIAKEGTVYFSDSRGGAVYIYKDGMVSAWLPDYPNPNGLCDMGDEMLICATKVGEVRLVNKASGEYKVLATGISGDGIAYSGYEGYYIVSEWSGKIHVIGQDSVQTILDTSADKINKADFGYNPKKKILYVPTFFDNRVIAYQLNAK